MSRHYCITHDIDQIPFCWILCCLQRQKELMKKDDDSLEEKRYNGGGFHKRSVVVATLFSATHKSLRSSVSLLVVVCKCERLACLRVDWQSALPSESQLIIFYRHVRSCFRAFEKFWLWKCGVGRLFWRRPLSCNRAFCWLARCSRCRTMCRRKHFRVASRGYPTSIGTLQTLCKILPFCLEKGSPLLGDIVNITL